MGIRGDSVLVPWRPAFWIAAEVVMDRLRSLPTYAPAGSHACGCGWGVVQIYYLYWLVGVCAYVCVCGLCLSNGGLAPV